MTFRFLLICLSCLLFACTPKLGASSPSNLAKESPASPPKLGIGEVLDPDLLSIQFGIKGLVLAEPIVQLGQAAEVELNFDVLGEDIREFRYDIVHCDKGWEPSQLNPSDYLEKFSEGDIRDYDLAFNTVSNYTHYNLSLPNQFVSWTKSGNYLLNVYDDDTGDLVMRLRFCVSEQLVTLDINSTRPGSVARDKTHQEFDVGLDLSQSRLENPRRTLTLSVIQNGDWRTGIYDLAPRFIRDDNLLWDYQNKLTFAAHREWRTLDIRTLRSAGGRVEEIRRDDDIFYIYLAPDPVRVDFPFETRIDLNGKYVIENFDNPSGVDDQRNFNLQSEYTTALFTLKMPRDESIEPLYLYGGLTNYQMNDLNEGKYNSLLNAYMFSTPLKQGFYNYAYVSADKAGFAPNWDPIEGNTFQTENTYSFLLYYRPYGERYDRLISYSYKQVNR
ncbi:MAG: DUF5103 domain-containing protein [Saprospiraceae bacterium]